MFRIAARLFLCAFVLSAAVFADATFTFYTNTGAPGTPTFNRPSSLGSLSGQITTYSVVSFYPNDDSTCSIYSTQEGDSYDGMIFLYQGPFDPTSPLTNLVALNDDFFTTDGGLGVGTSAIQRFPLSFSANWHLVTGGFVAGDAGTSTVHISCSDPATRVLAADGGLPAYDGRYSGLLGGRFQVSARWRNFASVVGDGTFVPLGSDDSGMIWFFGPQNFEVLVKMVNACSFNNRYWLFYSATTNVEFLITVYDTVSGITRTYHNPLGTTLLTAVTDTDAFATCP